MRRFFRPRADQPPREATVIPEPVVTWQFKSNRDAQIFVAMSARKQIEGRIRRVTLDTADAALEGLKAAIETGDELRVWAELRALMGVGEVVMQAEPPK